MKLYSVLISKGIFLFISTLNISSVFTLVVIGENNMLLCDRLMSVEIINENSSTLIFVGLYVTESL